MSAYTATPKVTEFDWKSHPAGMGGHRAIVSFENGYGASVLKGGMFYTKNGTYEIGVLDAGGGLTYETPIASDVLGYLSEEEANQALVDIAALAKASA